MGSCIYRLMDGMRRSVATLARAGNSCVVNDVMLSAADQRSYTDACTGIELHFVGLHAPLDVLEHRERDRGDRVVGLARWQYPRVHNGISYDFEIDTAKRLPDQIAREIAFALAIPLIES
jgi:chloramphenicol 3-O phosphotransferase